VYHSTIKYGCYFYLPRKLYKPKYTVRTEGIRITQYFIESSIATNDLIHMHQNSYPYFILGTDVLFLK